MADIAENPRWANYCRAHGRTSIEQLAHDMAVWPGGHMIGYIQWNRARLIEASYQIPEAFYMGHLADHEAYDVWLTIWVDKELAKS